MKRFQNILVGVDLAMGDRLVSDRIGEPSQQAIDTAITLAKVSGAKLCFVYALDVDAATERLIAEQTGNESNVVDQAEQALNKVVAKASESDISSSAQVLIGRSWQRLIQDVQKNGRDLVIMGTRDVGSLQRMLMGTTAMSLLRHCPCPVWVTKPGQKEITSVLVAHDLTPVGAFATELAASIAGLTGAKLHVLHALEHVEYEEIPRDSARPVRDEIQKQVEADLSGREASIHLTDDRPDEAILAAIEKFDVDLVVMGTIARTGISGLITGNTAERILPQLSCSVLAVKPNGFEGGVRDV